MVLVLTYEEFFIIGLFKTPIDCFSLYLE